MIESEEIVKKKLKSPVNWALGKSSLSLKKIHHKDVNIAIYERDTSGLKNEIDHLLKANIEFRSSGTINAIVNEMTSLIDPKQYSVMIQDIKECLYHFNEISNAKSFRLLLATVNTNMCRKFHTDINDLRMLCTYSGPGTLWLTDENINPKASASKSIVIDEKKIQQVKTGAVVLLKGALYPQYNTKTVVHRSPTIEETGEKRLLLRIDTNESLNFL